MRDGLGRLRARHIAHNLGRCELCMELGRGSRAAVLRHFPSYGALCMGMARRIATDHTKYVTSDTPFPTYN